MKLCVLIVAWLQVGHLHLNDPQRLEQLVQSLLPPQPNSTPSSSSIPSPQQTQEEGVS
jgi:hypothetical protein